MGSFSKAHAQEDKNLQLKLGEAVSVYSEKAYRKDAGKLFEAVGNVVILSGKETLYGEKASLDMSSGRVSMEGNVRFISRNITIYGSKIEFNSATGQLSMSNARIITGEFNVVAESLIKTGDGLYHAKKAEFTTCKDCSESWSIYGEDIFIELNQYVQIHHALTKIKGIHVLYLPYIALPIKTKRESGLLFPSISTRPDEGVAFQQPIYWAIDDSKDLTLTPSFWGIRGLGTDLQYRQVFAEDNWLEYNHRFLEDKIYLPGKTDKEVSERSYFRHFYEFEAHQQWSNSLTSHIVATGTKDLDFFRDFSDYTDDYLLESSTGVNGFLEKRFMNVNLGLEAQYRRNLFVSDPTMFDKSYVQTLPSMYFNVMPQNLYHSDKLFLQNISFGMDSDYTVFRQKEEQDGTFLRNAARFSASPYLHWHFFNYGPVSMSSKYTQHFQEYNFRDDDQKYFQKHAGFLKTELSFTMDKIFGLAFEEKLSVKDLSKDELKKVFPEKKDKKNGDLVGHIPDFEESLTEDSIVVVKNSYRHSQEFKFIHHLITDSN
ncbi:MAG: LPS-assembly protein LptD, partial [Bacteriovoracaceae bacterium]|nr:LPS-assembly protein LptD [Bacteriovoracaceae bacterium]